MDNNIKDGSLPGFTDAPHVCKIKVNVVLALVIYLCLLSINGIAQQADTSDKVRISIDNTEVITYLKTDSGEFHKFIGNVKLRQGTDTLYCDSAYQNSTTKNFEAFGDVRIAQLGGTQGTSDYLRYTADKKLAFMRGNVVLTDGKNNLKCEELTYDLGTKTGEYDKGGTLHSDSTTVQSNAGVYNVKNKDARFRGNVVITDPKYKIKSEDLGYNTETKVETFFARSVVTSDSGKSVLVTTRGWYDSRHVIAHFTGHSSIWNDGQYIEADTMQYNKITGYGFADGNVISIDTAHHSTLYCNHAEYFRKQRVLWATIKPVMEQVNGKDTLYMRADTFYSAPMMREVVSRKSLVVSPGLKKSSAKDSTVAILQGKTINGIDTLHVAAGRKDTPVVLAKSAGDTLTKAVLRGLVDTVLVAAKPLKTVVYVVPETKFRLADFIRDTIYHKEKYRPEPEAAGSRPEERSVSAKASKKSKKKKLPADSFATKNADAAAADTTAPMYFSGYHHVLIFSDSLQGKCDSVCYTRYDSTIKMIYAPIVWAHNSQITGDTILLHLDSSHITSMYVPNNATVISQSGPEKAKLYDQVQGKTLTGYFTNNEIRRMIVYPNAESIYYSKDEKGAYLGVTQATSERMRIFFADQKITNLILEQDVHQTMTPLEKADIPGMKLSRFKWLMDERPKTKEELFR